MADRQIPEQWGGWALTDLIGEGAYGSVYLAEKNDGQGTLRSAVKVIDIPSDESDVIQLIREFRGSESVKLYFEDMIADYMKEIQFMNELKGNENIVSIEDYIVEEHQDKIGWTIYIRMEYLKSFTDYYTEKQMTEQDVLKMAIDICSALEICERSDIIHRDIKPDNIFVTDQQHFKLGDFGVARQIKMTVGSYSAKGTFTYMAPEIYHGRKYGITADIYSLGIVVYKLLNKNRDPFLDTEKQLVYYKDKEEALSRRMKGEHMPAPVNASSVVAKVVLKAVAYHSRDRYQSAQEFKQALQSALKKIQSGKYKRRVSQSIWRRLAAASVVAAALGTGFTLSNPSTRDYIKSTPLGKVTESLTSGILANGNWNQTGHTAENAETAETGAFDMGIISEATVPENAVQMHDTELQVQLARGGSGEMHGNSVRQEATDTLDTGVVSGNITAQVLEGVVEESFRVPEKQSERGVSGTNTELEKGNITEAPEPGYGELLSKHQNEAANDTALPGYNDRDYFYNVLPVNEADSNNIEENYDNDAGYADTGNYTLESRTGRYEIDQSGSDASIQDVNTVNGNNSTKTDTQSQDARLTIPLPTLTPSPAPTPDGNSRPDSNSSTTMSGMATPQVGPGSDHVMLSQSAGQGCIVSNTQCREKAVTKGRKISLESLFPGNYAPSDKNVKCVSENSGIAAVEEGYVRAKNLGTTRIIRIVDAVDDSYCEVTVRRNLFDAALKAGQAFAQVKGNGLIFVLNKVYYKENCMYAQGYLVNRTGKRIIGWKNSTVELYLDDTFAAQTYFQYERFTVPLGKPVPYLLKFEDGQFTNKLDLGAVEKGNCVIKADIIVR